MALKIAPGACVLASQSFTSNFEESEAFVQFLRTHLHSAGWAQSVIMAKMTFTMSANILNSYLDIDGERFEITDPDHPPVHGGHEVPNGRTVKETLENLGGVVSGINSWSSVVGGPEGAGAFITFTLPDSEDITDDGNNLFCDVVPTGAVGFYDFSPDGVGTGRTWGGGYLMTSAFVSSNPVELKIQNTNINNLVTVKTQDDKANFNGLVVTNDLLAVWRIVANKYQFALFVPGNFSDGHFMLASHLFPTTGTVFANYITGPTIIAPSAGQRSNLESISGNYYFSSVFGTYTSRNGLGTPNQVPTLVIPGFGTGATPVDKLANPIAFDILRNTGIGFPYDSFLAVCRFDPQLSAETVRIIGQYWDSLIYSAYGAPDSTGFIGTKSAVSLFAQTAIPDHAGGSFMLMTEH